MPIPGPGTAISMTTIATEFGGTVPHSLNEYYRGGGLVPNTPTNAAIPTSGSIAMGNFYGSANRNIVNLTISASTQNYDVYANRGPAYVAGVSDITVTVNPGVVVGSSAIPTYAMLVPSGFSPTDTVTIVNNGTIAGRGGNGGNGGSGAWPLSNAGLPGGGGGNALFVNRPTIITNNGTVGGGGGGGGGAGGFGAPPKFSVTIQRGGGGGGGGAGNSVGAGGAGGAGAPGLAGSPGSSGALLTGGAGAPSNPPSGGAGGAGGGLGSGGSSGNPSIPGNSGGGAGGARGNYIVGNPFVTWPVTGTRLGGVA